MAQREILTGEGYGNAVRELAPRFADSGFVPDVARSGPIRGIVDA
ncbi:hypothetical protein [Aeromicrobium phragmitis]|nr:hypothetical protein [Aeromicrobium phragmitis]